MHQKTFNTLSGTIFLLIALAHMARIVYGWEAQIAGMYLSPLVSYLAAFVGLAMAHAGFSMLKVKR